MIGVDIERVVRVDQLLNGGHGEEFNPLDPDFRAKLLSDPYDKRHYVISRPWGPVALHRFGASSQQKAARRASARLVLVAHSLRPDCHSMAGRVVRPAGKLSHG